MFVCRVCGQNAGQHNNQKTHRHQPKHDTTNTNPNKNKQDCILGQYVAGNGQPGYLDDDTVPRGSKTPTFAACRLTINNERWAGVPFVLRAGKALNERGVFVRVQLLPQATPLFNMVQPDMRNELVLRLQPGEAMWAKMVVKAPGLDMAAEMSELDLSYGERYLDAVIPDAYERLILDCIRGDQQHFVRRDELRAAWAVFTPLLAAIDAGEVDPEPYAYGSRGPPGQDAFLASTGESRTTEREGERGVERATEGGEERGQGPKERERGLGQLGERRDGEGFGGSARRRAPRSRG